MGRVTEEAADERGSCPPTFWVRRRAAASSVEKGAWRSVGGVASTRRAHLSEQLTSSRSPLRPMRRPVMFAVALTCPQHVIAPYSGQRNEKLTTPHKTYLNMLSESFMAMVSAQTGLLGHNNTTRAWQAGNDAHGGNNDTS